MSKKEHALAGLQLPELVIQRQGKSRYQVRCQLEEGTNLTIVGRVFADQEFGPISFYQLPHGLRRALPPA